MQKKPPELLSPAGSLQKLKTAILYGADAVYCGTPDLSMRTQSKFTLEEIIEGVKFAHEHNKKIYLTLNLYTHNKDVEKLPEFLETIKKINPDGLIISDPGVFQYVKEHAPNLKLHISTQANVCSYLTVDFWQKMGAELCVLGREVTFEELKEIRKKCPNIKLETFIHGAMCMSYSGRCLISNFLAERGANQGNCAHSCRWNYKLHLKLKDGRLEELEINDNNKELFEFLAEEEFRPGDFMPIEEIQDGTYLFNSKDLCLLPKIDKYLKIGIDSLKIEGRNKTNYYVALTTLAYRQAIDDWLKNPENWQPEKYMGILYSLQNRGYTIAFHEGRLKNLSHNYLSAKSVSEFEYAGFICEWENNEMIFEIKNTLESGDLMEFITPAGKIIRLRLEEFIDNDTKKIVKKVSPGQKKAIRIPKNIFQSEDQKNIKKILPVLTIARKKNTITASDKKRLILDLESYESELNNMDIDRIKKENLIKEIKNEKNNIQNLSIKKTKPVINSCCGKGCNGCSIFLHDPKFEHARQELKNKKLGEKLT